MSDFTISGDAEHYYVSDRDGHIVATCADLPDAEREAERLNVNARDCVCGRQLMYARSKGYFVHTDDLSSPKQCQ